MNIQKQLCYVILLLLCNNIYANKCENTNFCSHNFAPSIFVDNGLKQKQKLIEACKQKPRQTFHLFSHGKQGKLFIENRWLNPSQIAKWLSKNNFLHNHTQLNIYGCEFAKGRKGKAAVVYLENILGICVAASDNITGKDGDWNLEVGTKANALVVEGYHYNLQTCTVNAGVPTVYCNNEEFVLDGLYGQLNGDGSTILWTVISQPAGANAIIANPNAEVTTVGGSLPLGDYTFQFQQTCGDGSGVASQQVTHTLIDGATTADLPATFTFGCYDGSTPIDITGNAPGPGETVSWDLVFGGGYSGTLTNANTQTVSFTPEITNTDCLGTDYYTTELKYIISNGGCFTSDVITIEYYYEHGPIYVYAVPQVVKALPGCTELFASCSLDGSGLWTATGPGNVTFTDDTDPNTFACMDRAGEYEFTWTITGGCNPGSDSYGITVLELPAGVPTSVELGPDQAYCQFPSTLTLNAPPLGLGHSGQWTQVNGIPATIIDPNAASTTVTDIINGGGPYTFLYELNAGECNPYDYITFTEVGNIEVATTSAPGCNRSGATPYYSTSPIPLVQWDTIAFDFELLNAPTTANFLKIRPYTYIYNADGTECDFDIFSIQVSVEGITSFKMADIAPDILPSCLDDGQYFVVTFRNSLDWQNTDGYYDLKITYKDQCQTIIEEVNADYIDESNTLQPNAGTDAILPCGVDATQLSGNAIEFPQWTMLSGPGDSPFTISGASSYLNRDPVISDLVDGKYVFQYSYVGEDIRGCQPGPDTITVLVSSVIPPAAIASVLTTSPCADGPVELTGNLPSTAFGQWTQIAPATPLATILPSDSEANVTLTNLTASTSYTFRWTLTNGCGTSSADVSFTTGTDAGPSVAAVTQDYDCSTSTTGTLNATTPTVGTGTWTQISGTPALTITDVNSESTTATGMTPGVLYGFEWAVSNPPCSTVSRDTTFIVSTSGLTIDAGLNQDFCDVSSFPITVSLLGNSDAEGIWSLRTAPSPAIFSDNTSPTSSVTINAPGIYTFEWNVGGFPLTDSDCLSFSDVVTYTFSNATPIPDAGADQNSCEAGGVFTMAATTPTAPFTGYWSIVSASPGTSVSFSDYTSPSSTVTLSNPGQVVLRWNIPNENSFCTPSYDEITLTWAEAVVNEPNQMLCDLTSTILEAQSAIFATTTWSQISGPNTATIYDTNLPHTVVDNLIPGTYEFQYEVDYPSLPCTSTDIITLTIDDFIVADGGPDQTFCGGETITLTGNTPSSGTAMWSLLGGPTGTFADATSGTTTFGNLVADSTYVFAYTITNGACSSMDLVFVYPFNNNIISYTTTDATCGNTDGTIDLNISGSAGTNYTYAWSNSETTEDISGLAGGMYPITITHPSGCQVTQTIPVAVSDGHTIALNNIFHVCPYETGVSLAPTVSGGSGTFSYLWNTGATSPSITVDMNGEVDTTFTVQVTDDATGCVSSADATLFYEGGNSVINAGEDVLFCTPGASIDLGATVSPPSGGPNFVWSTGETTDSITVSPLVATTYMVSIIGENGCEVKDEVRVFPSDLSATTSPNDTTICVGSIIMIDGVPSNGIAPYANHSWTDLGTGTATGHILNDAITQTLTLDASMATAGTIDLEYSVMDNNGCLATENITITVNESPLLTIDNIACDANLTTYTIDFTSNGTVTSDIGTISTNQIIDIPVNTDVNVTATLNGCIIQETIVSPICEPLCPATKCARVIITKK